MGCSPRVGIGERRGAGCSAAWTGGGACLGARGQADVGTLRVPGSLGSLRGSLQRRYGGQETQSGPGGVELRRRKHVPAARGALFRLREHGRRGLGFWGGGGGELRTQGPGWGLNKGRRPTWACVPGWKAGAIPGEDPGFGCAGEGDGTGRWARTVSGLGQRATLAGRPGECGVRGGRAGGAASGPWRVRVEERSGPGAWAVLARRVG